MPLLADFWFCLSTLTKDIFTLLTHILLIQLPHFVVGVSDGRQDSAMNLTTNGTNSISMSVELNGVVYTGELLHRAP